MTYGKTMIITGMASLMAGMMFTAGVLTGAGLQEENEFHVERFEVQTIDGEGFFGEPVERNGVKISGEGVQLDVKFVPITVNEGETVDIYWTHAQAENGDWDTPAKIEEVE